MLVRSQPLGFCRIGEAGDLCEDRRHLCANEDDEGRHLYTAVREGRVGGPRKVRMSAP